MVRHKGGPVEGEGCVPGRRTGGSNGGAGDAPSPLGVNPRESTPRREHLTHRRLPPRGFRHTASKDAPISEPCPLMPRRKARSLPFRFAAGMVVKTR